MTPETIHLPEGASNFAADYNGLFYFIFWVCVIFFVIITVGTLGFLVAFRHKGGVKTHTPGITHNTALEIFWTVIPTLLILVMFWQGFKVYLNYWVAPKDAYVINVTASQWNWTYAYDTPDGTFSDRELVVPAGRATKLVMTSQDVIHSLFIPDFRVKMDVIPRRTTSLWFEALEPNATFNPDKEEVADDPSTPNINEHRMAMLDYELEDLHDLYCTEYCGTLHSKMERLVVVLSQDDYAAWLKAKAKPTGPLWEIGETVAKNMGCQSCHSVDGAAGIGPSWYQQFGTERQVTENGSTLTVVMDEAYIAESIHEPQKKVVAGFEPVMPANNLTDENVRQVTAFIASLSDSFNPDDWGGVPGEDSEEPTGEAPTDAPAETPEDAPVPAPAP